MLAVNDDSALRPAAPLSTMPVPGFLASIADKAQNAINTSPLGSLTQQSSDGSSGHRHTLDNISNQLRVISQQYSYVVLLLHNRTPHIALCSVTSPIQKVITTEKSVALDSETLSRDAKYQSKELFTWGRNESEDLKDSKGAHPSSYLTSDRPHQSLTG